MNILNVLLRGYYKIRTWFAPYAKRGEPSHAQQRVADRGQDRRAADNAEAGSDAVQVAADPADGRSHNLIKKSKKNPAAYAMLITVDCSPRILARSPGNLAVMSAMYLHWWNGLRR